MAPAAWQNTSSPPLKLANTFAWRRHLMRSKSTPRWSTTHCSETCILFVARYHTVLGNYSSSAHSTIIWQQMRTIPIRSLVNTGLLSALVSPGSGLVGSNGKRVMSPPQLMNKIKLNYNIKLTLLKFTHWHVVNFSERLKIPPEDSLPPRGRNCMETSELDI